MGLFNRFSDLFKTEEDYDEGYDTSYEDEAVEEQDAPQQQTVTPRQTQQSAQSRATSGINSSMALEMKVIKPERFEAVTQIGDHLLARRTVVLNLEDTNKETVRRIIDFCSGVAFAIEGQIKRVANSTYIITPKNVDVSGDQPERDEPKSQRELF
ncbi:MAG TPA: cell division protein SepF [Bacillota bacterium]|nr:cell division protein SepF [Bacillota bacterium]HOK69583.1 cell division protein SepF [Bacillota bacterium]HPP85027.1 cell division protein SepF [Bacillota bacterium]